MRWTERAKRKAAFNRIDARDISSGDRCTGFGAKNESNEMW